MRECRDKLDIDGYMHVTVLYLAEYDRVNNSDLGKTLYNYLACNRSIAQTAETMHLHKNTITYRINKIKEISGLDFADTMDIFHVLLSYLLNESRRQT